MDRPLSFFYQAQLDAPFEDKFEEEGIETSVDVIIPILHATPFWEQNLKSYFREIPINRLLIGDAGAIDGSIELARKFPRVEIMDHANVTTLARSIALLISSVRTDHFIYLQSDTYLPPGWFESMWSMRQDFDWFGCPERSVLALTGPLNDYSGKRPLAGTQFGKTAAFEGIEREIHDDFGYRQEDFIFEQFVLDHGYKTGANLEVFHFHQLADRYTSGRKLILDTFKLSFAIDDDDSRVAETQIWGLIKYCKPSNEMARRFTEAELRHLLASRIVSPQSLLGFATDHNEAWVPVIKSVANREKVKVAIGLRLVARVLGRLLHSTKH